MEDRAEEANMLASKRVCVSDHFGETFWTTYMPQELGISIGMLLKKRVARDSDAMLCAAL